MGKKLKECKRARIMLYQHKEIIKKEIKFGFNQEIATLGLDQFSFFVKEVKVCGSTVKLSLTN